jgi:hypothetical protein
MPRFNRMCAGLVGLGLLACDGGSGATDADSSGASRTTPGVSGEAGTGTGGTVGIGGAGSSGGSTGTGGMSGGGSGGKATVPADCNAPDPTVFLDRTMLDHLTGTGDGVVFIDRTKGLRWARQEMGGAVRRIAGRDDAVLYESARDELILSLAVHGGDVYYLEATYVGTAESARVKLHKVPLAGGTAAEVADMRRSITSVLEMIGVDGTNAYVNSGQEGILRVSLSEGAVAPVTAEWILHNAWIVGSDIYYTSNQIIAGTLFSKIAESATGEEGTVVALRGGCTDPFIADSGLWCVSGNIARASVQRFGLDGSGPTVPSAFDEGRNGRIVASDDAHVYYATSDLPAFDGHPIWQIPIEGGAPVGVVCDRHELGIADTDGVYPTARSLILEQVVANPGELIWLERRETNGPVSLYRAKL